MVQKGEVSINAEATDNQGETDSQKLHQLSLTLVKMQKVNEQMFRSQRSESDDVFYAQALRLENICHAMKTRIGNLQVKGLGQLGNVIVDATKDLNDKVIELQNMVQVANTTNQILDIISGIVGTVAGFMPK